MNINLYITNFIAKKKKKIIITIIVAYFKYLTNIMECIIPIFVNRRNKHINKRRNKCLITKLKIKNYL